MRKAFNTMFRRNKAIPTITQHTTADGHIATIKRVERITLCVPIQWHINVYDQVELSKIIYTSVEHTEDKALSAIEVWTKEKYCTIKSSK